MGEDRADDDPVLDVEATLERFPQRRQFLAQLALGQLGEHGRVGRARDERVQHRPPRRAEDVCGDAVELDPRILEDLVQPVRLPLALADLRLAVAGQVPQRPDRLRRHETAFEQARLQQLAQPGRVRNVRLAARHLLDMARVDEQTIELVLEDRPRRLPVDAAGLHRHLGRAVRLQPVAQREQPLHRRLELRHLLLTPATPAGTRTHAVTCSLCTSNAAGRSTTVSIACSLQLDDTIVAWGASETDESDGRARSNSPGCRQGPHAKLTTGSQAPSETGVSRRPPDPRRFHPPAGGRPRPWPTNLLTRILVSCPRGPSGRSARTRARTTLTGSRYCLLDSMWARESCL